MLYDCSAHWNNFDLISCLKWNSWFDIRLKFNLSESKKITLTTMTTATTTNDIIIVDHFNKTISKMLVNIEISHRNGNKHVKHTKSNEFVHFNTNYYADFVFFFYLLKQARREFRPPLQSASYSLMKT